MPAYYNEIDPFAADWLENLIAAGHIAPGVVDRRSIEDVRPDDLRDFDQCHFFAGLGGWSLALRLARFPDDGQVWTGSCPCPPFSTAGRGQRCPECGSTSNICHPRKTGHFVCLACGCDRHADDRHLYPEFARLIRERRPTVVLGEQVASRDGRLWLAAVRADLEAMGYGVGAADLCAAGVGAPHIRQRSWFVADATDSGRLGRRGNVAGDGREAPRVEPERLRDAGLVGDADDTRLEGRSLRHGQRPCEWAARTTDGHAGRVGLADSAGPQPGHEAAPAPRYGRSAVAAGRWTDADWLHCIDGKARPVEPGTFPLAHGVPSRVGRLRAYGNAIVPQAAAAFIQAAVPFRLGVFA